jgi:hypothetical protein
MSVNVTDKSRLHLRKNKSRLKLKNADNLSVANLTSSSLLFKNVEIKIHKTVS